MLHPIIALEQVLEEYRSYLMTEFRARDPALRQALETALDEPGFLAREPFYQAHRPFKPGEKWRDLPLDAKLAGAPVSRSGSERAYLRQSDSIDPRLCQSGPNERRGRSERSRSHCSLPGGPGREGDAACCWNAAGWHRRLMARGGSSSLCGRINGANETANDVQSQTQAPRRARPSRTSGSRDAC